MKNKNIYVTLASALAVAVLLRAAFASSVQGNSSENSHLLAANTTEPAAEQSGATSTPSAAAKTATAPAAPDKTEESDGKTVLPAVGDGKETLGKETLGKETLPAVGEQVGTKAQEVDPYDAAAPPEYLGKRLLSSPNPVNISGPVVSGETPAD